MQIIRLGVAAAVASVVLAGAGTAAVVAAPAHGNTNARTAAAPAAAPNRLRDGGFELPRVAPNTFREFAAGQSFGPWRVLSGSVDLIGAGFWQAAQGAQSLDLNGNNAGAVSQTFATVPGKSYMVTYALAGNTDCAPVVKTGKVLIDGQDFQDFTFDTTGKSRTNMGYVYRQVPFAAVGRSTTLAFASTTLGSACGPVVDRVLVTRS
ncbi:choice-of-anchor C family protein [Streptomyces sp. NPDC047000]|uniref:choice-of-anchor C family protein n=1 Tax=Streptomyces sp. NPDC047000 TaxID=3155474 RepID=UPI0033C83884